MNDQDKPFLAVGGFQKASGWVFLTPHRKSSIQGCNTLLKSLWPLCDGTNTLLEIIDKLKGIEEHSLRNLINTLEKHQILLDINHVFELHFSFTRHTNIFSRSLSQEEDLLHYYDKSHLGECKGELFSFPFSHSPLAELLKKRTSTRRFSDKPITPETISTLLWSMYGKIETKISSFSHLPYTRYTAPSAGGLYPLVMHLILLKPCKELKPGIYIWHKEDATLELHIKGTFVQELKEVITGVDNECIEQSTGCICINACFERTAKKYGTHALNLVMLDAGHAVQNAYLYCAENDLGMVEIYGFNSDGVRKLINQDNVDQNPVLLISFGPL